MCLQVYTDPRCNFVWHVFLFYLFILFRMKILLQLLDVRWSGRFKYQTSEMSKSKLALKSNPRHFTQCKECKLLSYVRWMLETNLRQNNQKCDIKAVNDFTSYCEQSRAGHLLTEMWIEKFHSRPAGGGDGSSGSVRQLSWRLPVGGWFYGENSTDWLFISGWAERRNSSLSGEKSNRTEMQFTWNCVTVSGQFYVLRE